MRGRFFMSTIAITNVRVFDGMKLSEPKTVVIEEGLISSKTTGETIVDGQGGTLLPGLIDSHVHVDVVEHLESAVNAGVTTMFEMANFSPENLDSLRNRRGLTNLIASYYPATASQKMNLYKRRDC
jgi:dihydroorotase-like cyclic amidohydrolase